VSVETHQNSSFVFFDTPNNDLGCLVGTGVREFIKPSDSVRVSHVRIRTLVEAGVAHDIGFTL